VVFQWPCGTLAVSLAPRSAQPRKVAMLVLVQVSSMKTRRCAFAGPGWPSAGSRTLRHLGCVGRETARLFAERG
jgi:hypothetical protein